VGLVFNGRSAGVYGLSRNHLFGPTLNGMLPKQKTARRGMKTLTPALSHPMGEGVGTAREAEHPTTNAE
jgi:hypothetical protein